MKKIIIICLFQILYSTIYPQATQDWVKLLIGYSTCYSVAFTSDDNCVAVGRMAHNYMILKLNSNGNELWQKISNRPNENDEARKVIVNNNGELMIAGNRGEYPLLLKTNSFGDTVWTRHIIENDTMIGQIRAMQPISDSGYVLAGVFGDSFHLDENRIWVIRTDNEGNTVWSKLFTYGFASTLTIDVYNNILVAGGAQLLKLNSNGDIIWNKTITGDYYYDFFSVKEIGTNGFILVGSSSASDYKDLCLVKINYDGVKIWEKMYGGNYEEVGKDVIATVD